MANFLVYIQLLLIWLISTVILHVLFTRNHNKNDHKKLPSPPSLPIVGHLHLISSIPHQSFHKLSTRYGPIMQIYLGSIRCVVVSSPEIAKEFLKTHETCFSNRFVTSAVRYLSYGLKGFLFAPYGEYWKFVRKLCMSELLNGKTLDHFLSLRQQETKRFLRALQEKGEAGEPVDVGGQLLTFTNSVISRMTMSTRASSEEVDDDDAAAEEIRKMVADTAALAGKFNVSDFIWFLKNLDLQRMSKRLKEIFDRFDSMMERIIKEHEVEMKKMKEQGSEGARMRDLLDILLEIQQDKSNHEIELTRENIKAFILDIFMAGTDTSAITTEWALAELINNPHVMEKARKEIESIVGNKRLIQESDLFNLPYLRAIVKETLRLYPASPILGRESTKSCNVCGYEIPPKTVLFVNLWSMGRDPKIWDNPLEFRPERFTEQNHQIDVRGQIFQLLPFGTGRRVCPGTSLALQLIPTNLGAMIQCFDWKVRGGADGTVSMEEKPGMTLPRANPLVCVPIPRFREMPFDSNFCLE